MTIDAPETGPDPDMLAAELALGVLDGEERAGALRRMLADPAFAREVDDWRDRLAGLFDDYRSVAAPESRVDRLEAGPPRRAPMRSRWPLAALAAGLAAAAILFVETRPRPSPPPAPVTRPQLLMLAALAPTEKGGVPLAAAFNADSGEMWIAATTMAPVGKTAQLWAIRNGAPQSLGLLNRGAPTRIVISPQRRATLGDGVVLAVSIEPPGGSPKPTPTGPVVASGALTAA